MQKNRLAAAYAATTYRAQLPGGEVSLRVGAPCPALDVWLRAEGYDQWAYLTAANPRSRRRSAAQNHILMQALEQALQQLGAAEIEKGGSLCNRRPIQWRSGVACADAADWPNEPSFLVAGLSPEVAITLAARFQQNALLLGRLGSVVELVWVSPSDPAG